MTRFSIYERIKELRDEQGLTQEEFAEKLHKSREAVKNWESGIRNIKADDIISISETFGVSADWLLGLSNSPTREGDQQKAEEYTGLSSKSIDTIHKFKNTDYADFINVLDKLLSDDMFYTGTLYSITKFFDTVTSFKEERYNEIVSRLKTAFEANNISALILPPADTAYFYADKAGDMLSNFLKASANISLFNAMIERNNYET